MQGTLAIIMVMITRAIMTHEAIAFTDTYGVQAYPGKKKKKKKPSESL